MSVVVDLLLNMNRALNFSLKEMVKYNRQYLRNMGTVIEAEKGLLTRESLDSFKTGWTEGSWLGFSDVREKLQGKENLPRTLTEMVIQRIEKEGLANGAGKLIIKCKDKKIRQYDPAKWAETMARTRSRALQEEGLHNQMYRAGFDLVMVSTGGSDDACADWEGEILSISGENTNFPTVKEAQDSGEVFHPRCFVDPNVRVLTNKGWKKIKIIKVGDRVKTHTGKYDRVIKLIRGKIKKGNSLFRFSVWDYKNNRVKWSPFMTLMHPVLTERGWTKVENLLSKDKVLCLLCGKIGMLSVIDVKEIRIRCNDYYTYNLEVDDDQSYIAEGFVVHNCVHSTSPYLLDVDKEGKLKVWGRDTVTEMAFKQLIKIT
jgi:UDP-N-acetylglucosamine transferase subunit ALG13